MTRTLILTRHAKSSWKDPSLADHDRPLNKRGRRAAPALGAWLAARGLRPDQVLCSSARRCRDTLAGIEAGMGATAPAEVTADLYHVTAAQILRRLQRASGATVLVLGHNPGIAACARQIAAAPPDHPRFADYPTGATLVLRFEIDDWARAGWGMGAVVDFITPRELTG